MPLSSQSIHTLSQALRFAGSAVNVADGIEADQSYQRLAAARDELNAEAMVAVTREAEIAEAAARLNAENTGGTTGD